jgi:hypothetical protein
MERVSYMEFENRRKTVLLQRSKIYVDVCNVLFYTDLFLYQELKKRMSGNKILRLYFKDKFPKGENLSNDWICHITAAKNHINILEDWIDKDKFIQINGLASFNSYLSYIYYDMLCDPCCGERLQLTEIGSAMKYYRIQI